MATKLFLRSTAGNAIGNYYDMVTTAGDTNVIAGVTSVSGGTEIQWTQGVGNALAHISGRVPSGGFTLSGTMTFSIWSREANMSANCGARARVFKRTSGGTETEIGGGPFDDGVELGTSVAEMVWTGTPTSTSFSEDDRLIVRFYITNIGTMGDGYNIQLYYNAPDASDYDSFFQINENVTFKAESSAVTHATTGILANTGAAVDGTSAVKKTHPTTGVLANAGAAVDGTSALYKLHATTGVLANTGAVVAGTATNFTPHATSGVLANTGAAVDGAATNFTPHATSGVLANSGATIAGSATNFTAHATTGVLATAGATIAGASSNFTPHATSGVLATTGATVTGASERTGSTVTHDTTGVLANAGASVAGTSVLQKLHATTGALANTGAAITGTSTRFRAYATSGVLTAAGATVTGSAERAGGATTHDTSGTLANAGSVVVGTAARFRAFATTGVLAGAGATVSAISTKTTAGALGWFNWGSAPPSKKQIQQERERLGILPKQVTRLKRAAKKAVETAQNPTEATQRAQEALIDSGVWDNTMQSILSLLIAFYADEFQRTLRINANKRLEQARILQEEEDIVFVAMLLAA